MILLQLRTSATRAIFKGARQLGVIFIVLLNTLFGRVGPLSDGGKWVCKEHLPPASDSNCVIFSLGSNGDFSFEQGMHEAAPHCKVGAVRGIVV